MNEEVDRLLHISTQALRDGITPNERVRRRIQEAIGYGNPLIDPGHSFVVMGMDGMDRSMFPCGSTIGIEEARELARLKIKEEPQYSFSSDGDDIGVGSTFYVYTMDGIPVPLEEISE